MTPQFPHPFFLILWVGTVLNPFGRPGIVVTTASKYSSQGGYSKFGLSMNILCRNLGQYTPQNKNRHLMKPWSHGGVAWNLVQNPGKITKYGVLVRMVCEAVSGHISAEGKKLDDTVIPLLHRNVGQKHHIYQDNYYNSVTLAQTLLDRNMRACGILRASRGIPRDLEEDRKHLKKGQSAFQRKGDVIVQVWKDKRLV